MNQEWLNRYAHSAVKVFQLGLYSYQEKFMLHLRRNYVYQCILELIIQYIGSLHSSLMTISPFFNLGGRTTYQVLFIDLEQNYDTIT